MTVRILRDVEEAISREVRRITFFEDRSLSHTVLKEMFDPFTGEVVSIPIEPDFYDSSADTKAIHYPHFFVKLLRINEDRTTGRVIPQYGKSAECQVTTSPKAFEIVLYQSDGVVALPGNLITTSALKIRKAQPGYLLRILTGNNIGTYLVEQVIPKADGNHEIIVSSNLLENLPLSYFNTSTRVLTFAAPVDLNTVAIGDIFVDKDGNNFNILLVDINSGAIEIDGVDTPNLEEGGSVVRVGNVFKNADPQLVSFTVMDPNKPILTPGGQDAYSSTVYRDPAVPLNLYYLIRIDSNERDDHIDVANRMWEEFNPPRTGLPTIVRSASSAEELITQDVEAGSDTIPVKDNTKFKVNDTVFIFNDLTPTKDVKGRGFQEVFTAKIKELSSTNEIILDKTLPRTFKAEDCSKIVSNAQYWIFMFHLEDHITRDVEGAQYWVHEFTFWVQVWVDRQGEPVEYEGVVQQIGVVGNGMQLDGPTILEI